MIDFDRIRDDILKWPCSQLLETQKSLLDKAPLFDIEVSSICNLECKFCPRNEIIRKSKFLGPELFEVLYNWLPENAVVMFSGLGECLLNKNISSYIEKLKKRNISSCIITNGVLLTPDKQKELIKSGIDQIQISYLTTDKNRYMGLVGNKGDFETLNRNLQHLSGIRPSGLRVQLNFLDTDINSSDFHEINEIAGKWGFDIFYRREHSRGGSNPRSDCDFGFFNSCLRCGTFASVHFVTTDGNIIPCSNDTRSANILGNITSSGYTSVLKNKLMLMSDKNEFDICKRCTDDYRWYTLWKGNRGKSN
ncbi:MAG: hypothetical protein PWQ63_722 [Methanolobus sp.]|nr:hypothetical protein [Methanolobus sp.]